MNRKNVIIEYIDLGIVPYKKAYWQQKIWFEEAVHRKMEHQTIQNKIIFCEHPHVITVGKHGSYSNLLFSPKYLKKRQIALYQTDRGGDVTYHGYGQIVCYPILDLEVFQLGLKEYIYRLEEIIIRTLEEKRIQAKCLKDTIGVWVGNESPRKIAAIGVRSSKYITMHGFALNVNTDLSFFKLIHPCGFIDKGVTSMEEELKHSADLEEIKNILWTQFQRTFSIK